MPKILINEIDNTMPGATNRYSNYTVLVAGFMGDGDGKKITPDSNGIYTFSSAQDFVDTIGLVAPEYVYRDSEHTLTVHHYGNQMAHELLSLGYPVIYLPIDPDDGVGILANEDTWEIFKDRVSYDFRFITHGLLKSYKAGDASGLENRINELKAALTKLNELLEDSLDVNIEQDTNSVLEKIDTLESTYVDFHDSILNGTQEALPGLNPPKKSSPYTTLYGALFGDADGVGILAELANKQALFDKRVFALDNKIPVKGEDGSQVKDEHGDLKFTYEDIGIINKANANIANLAKYFVDTNTETTDVKNGRGDCIALIELDENEYAGVVVKPEVKIISAINKMSGINAANGKYSAMTVPSVVYVDNKKMPGAFHYLTCFINALQSGYKEWYAAAGYVRGVSSYRIANTTVTLGEIAINALEPRNVVDQASSPKFACNVIANFRGSYYLWGNRTAHPLGEQGGNDGELVASHFLNIRQLCTTIKKQLYVACRRFTFDPNSDTLWFNFVNAIRPTLDNMKADQGIRDYKIIKDVEAKAKKATLKAKIRIIPIEAVEDFDIEVYLEDSFGETAVGAAESI